ILVVAIEFSQSADDVADVGADAELSHPSDVDGDFHRRHLTTEGLEVRRGIPAALGLLSGARFHLRSGPALGVERECLAKLKDLFADSRQNSGICAAEERLRDPAANLAHFVRFHPARGQGGGAKANAAGWSGGGAKANAAGLHWRVGVERDCILVDRDRSFAESLLRLAAQHSLG